MVVSFLSNVRSKPFAAVSSVLFSSCFLLSNFSNAKVCATVDSEVETFKISDQIKVLEAKNSENREKWDFDYQDSNFRLSHFVYYFRCVADSVLLMMLILGVARALVIGPNKDLGQIGGTLAKNSSGLGKKNELMKLDDSSEKNDENDLDVTNLVIVSAKFNDFCKKLLNKSTDFVTRDCKDYNLKGSNFGFQSICRTMGDFDLLASDNVCFETDSSGNLKVINNKKSQKEGVFVHSEVDFKMGENGVILVEFKEKKETMLLPVRLATYESVSGSVPPSNKKMLDNFCLFSYLDVETFLDLYLNGDVVSFKSSYEMILKLKEIFEKKDGSGLYFKRINMVLSIYNLLQSEAEVLWGKFCADGLALNAYRFGILKKILSICKDKEVDKEIRVTLSKGLERLCDEVLKS